MVLEDSDDSENITVGSGMVENIGIHIWKVFSVFLENTGKFRRGRDPRAGGRGGRRAPKGAGRPGGLGEGAGGGGGGWGSASPPSTRFRFWVGLRPSLIRYSG